MATVNVVATTKDVLVGADVIAAGFRVSITGADGVEHAQATSVAQAQFDDVAPGDYTASVAAVDSNGGQIGEKISAAFNVPTPAQVTVQGADTVTVSVS